jgi:PAS domain S-box-containing protein
VLLVEDDPNQLRLLQSLLVRRGVEVTACVDAESAWTEFQQRRYSLIVADWMLPGMTGLDLCRLIKSHADGADALIIVVTARTQPEDLEQVLEAGADDYLAKPVSPAQLDVRMSIAEHRVREVARRKLAEASLRVEQDRLDALMDHIPDSIYFKDRSGAYLRVNRAAARKFGLADPQEAVGKTDEDFYHPAYARTIRDDEAQVMATHTPIVAREDLEAWPDDRTSWSSTTKLPLLDRNGVLAGTFGVSRDITELKRQQQQRDLLERRVQQAQKLESLEVLAGGVAHDFNNLLTSILGNASLAAMDLTSRQNSAQSSLAAIESAARRAAELTRQMLAFSGKGRFVIEQLRLDELVHETLQLLASAIPKHLTLKIEVEPRQPVVEGDASQIRQALMNLVVNAAEAVGEGAGLVGVKVYGRRLSRAEAASLWGGSSLPGGLYSALEVSDSGAGMDDATMAKIFDPFFSTKFVGRGLGLAATLGIVRGHRGAIRVQSNPGAGSVFTLLFPSIQASEPTHEISSFSNLNVILVDQDCAVVDALGRLLAGIGGRCIAVQSVHEASKILPKMVASDAALVLEGREVAEGLLGLVREMLKRKPSLRIVWISALPQDADGEQIPLDIPIRFLSKPFAPADLLDAVR